MAGLGDRRPAGIAQTLQPMLPVFPPDRGHLFSYLTRWQQREGAAQTMMDKVQRAILENQIILAEALWMLLHSQGISSEAMLANVSARIKQTRELLEEQDEGNP